MTADTEGARSNSWTVHENVTSSNRLGAPSSVTRTVTAYGEPGAASNPMVPEMIPEPGSMETPGGRPVALQVRSSPSGSVAGALRDTASPSASDWSPMSPSKVGGRLVFDTVQVNTSRLEAPCWSVAVTVTEYGESAAALTSMVPEINPVAESIDTPGGSPIAEYVIS